MAQHFWVNNYFVDISRNQIRHQQQATQLPPKALKVLEVLASRAGDVVSLDELMELVWGKSVVGPNTLQRAIAQLRKAFGDDSKQQAFIKTHAKKGYSLEANVRWEESKTQPLQADSAPAATKPKANKGVWIVAVVVILAVGALWAGKKPQSELYDQLTPLTASDEQEFNASYSPDGKYLVFNRYVGQCISHLWAKDLTNNQEVRLSDAPGHYDGLAWSADGSSIALVLQSSCEDANEQVQQCWQLQTLDFAQAWKGEANSLIRFDCEQTPTTHPLWLNDGRIALLQYSDANHKHPALIIHDARSEQVTKVPMDHGGQLYSLAYSRAKDIFASTSTVEGNNHILRTFTTDGQILSEATIKRLPQHSVYRDFPITFSPDGEHFLTEVGGQIFRLSPNGDLELLHTAGFSGLSNAVYHPNQTKIAATQGSKDFDVGFLTTLQGMADVEVFSRSTEVDINSQFQPGGNLISFASYRSGDSQLWITDGETTYQLTRFEDGMRGLLYSWAPSGEALAVNANNKVVMVNLDGRHQSIDSPIAVNVLMPWTNPDYLLVTANQSDKDQLFSIDVNTGATTDLKLKDVMWAAYTDDNRIIYSDNQKHFWLWSQAKKEPLTALQGKLYGKRAVLKDGHLYGLDRDNQLWRYELATDKFETIAQVHKDVIYISDVKSDQMLATKFIGGRRELVELSVSD
ncbi:winged helix-turn-helix domain-containing protein [Bowmanella dokdonensis]|uniref:Winged helix-turn-helix domain-containing protein n=1 Tax=Bowmanella dokdonensis TaxID=751969 RepID=A0A939DNP9_9ALTE|nr:winged helix-turn-helix domain-containing protein [Bowmanella dokdonensis]MBN7826144.1 winged helix-turn-helix domain-containing protein [Bowmanella dokdonensis]